MTSRNLAWFLLVLILVALLGLAPRPHLATSALHSARRAQNAGNWQAAERYLSQAASQLPNRSDLWEQAASAALQADHPEAAIQYLENIGETKPSRKIELLLGDANHKAGNLPEAIDAWQAGLRFPGDSAEFYERLWQAERDLRAYPQAIDYLERLLQAGGGSPDLYYELALMQASQDPEAALPALAKAVEAEPALEPQAGQLRRAILSARRGEDKAYSLVSAGRALAALDRWPLAYEAFHQATEARPDYAEAWAFLGEAKQHLPPSMYQEAAGALQALEKALQLDPKTVSAHSFLSLYWEREGDLERAQAYAESAAALDPENPVWQMEKGRQLADAGDLEGAFEAYREALRLAPTDPATQRGMALFCLDHNYKLRSAGLEAARRAVILAPDDPLSLDVMAQVLTRLKDFENAERFLLRALQADPNSPLAHLHLGFVYLMRNEKGEARAELNTVIDLSPRSPSADHARRLLEAYFP